MSTPTPRRTSLSPKDSASDLGEPSVSTSALPEVVSLETQVPGPKISYAGSPGEPSGQIENARRISIQFAPTSGKVAKVARPASPVAKKLSRLSSPPPPSTYETRIAFDTFSNKAATDPSFTLVSKHKDYAYKKDSRTFLCGTDQKDYSDFALEYLVTELVEDGDEIICVRVVERDSKIASEVSEQQPTYKAEARKLLEHIQGTNDRCDGKAISLILEFAVGKVGETIDNMIRVYSPISLVVGTRGRSIAGIHGLLPGSVSQYCLQNSPVPVIVVRPQHVRQRKMEKRLADPHRQGYSSILEKSNASGSGAFETLSGQPVVEASEHEAEAVAKAIGLPDRFGKWKGSRDDESEDACDSDESRSPRGPLIIEAGEFDEMPNYVPGLGSADVSESEEENEQAEAMGDLSLAGSEDVSSGKDKGIEV